MKLRNKVLIGITLVWIIFTAVIFIGSKYFLINSFLALESDRANKHLSRVEQALDQNLSSLYTFTSDWSHWNDAYDFIQGKNPQFIPNNLNMTAYSNATINFLSYWDLNGKLLISHSVDQKIKNGLITR